MRLICIEVITPRVGSGVGGVILLFGGGLLPAKKPSGDFSIQFQTKPLFKPKWRNSKPCFRRQSQPKVIGTPQTREKHIMDALIYNTQNKLVTLVTTGRL